MGGEEPEQGEGTDARSDSDERKGCDEQKRGAAAPTRRQASYKTYLLILALLDFVVEEGHRRLGKRDGGNHAVRSVSGITAKKQAVAKPTTSS